MSVIGRLWKRAPAWRLWLFVAVATTGLAAMFPPRLPASPFPRRPPVAGPRYAPPPPAKSADYTALALPPITGTRQLLIPFAGRQVPLPLGDWSALVVLRAVGPVARQGVVLARLQSGRMTGMMIVLGTPALDRDSPLVTSGCVDPTGMPVHVLTAPGNTDPAIEECWSIRRLTTSKLVDSRNPVESRAFGRLGTLGIAVPSHLLASLYFRHDDHAALSVTILLPDPAESASLMRRTVAWNRRWIGLLHRGFEAKLTSADVTAALARDPGFAAN